MKHINALFFLLFAFLLYTTAEAQIRIPNTRVTIDFSGAEWNYLTTLHPSDNETIYVYNYESELFVDKDGDTIPPCLRIYVRKNYADSPYDLAYERYEKQPFQSLDEYMDGLPAEGIGYVGANTSPIDEKDYQFRMIYFKDLNNAIEIRLEVTRDNYPRVEKLFEDIMKTVKVSK